MDDEFSLSRKDRDAWASIRGYVYQIDTTILRWLKLQPDEFLELECGEDVDLISPAIVAGSVRTRRTLEQIKRVDGSFSLRSESSRQALASFAEHIDANPSLPIHFRFFTTAEAVAERPPHSLLFTPGVVLWQRIRDNKIDERDRVRSIESLAGFLQLLKPVSSQSVGWHRLITITHDLGRFEDFISRFEWSFGATNTENLSAEICDELRAKGYAIDSVTATARYEQLFVFTIRLLAQRTSDVRRRLGLKDLQDCVRSGAVDESDGHILSQLSDLRSIVAEGFSDLQKRVSDLPDKIEQRLLGGFGSRKGIRLPVTIDGAEVRKVFRATSSGLLSWPRRISQQWLDRPELEGLERTIETNEKSCTVLLGTPGCGKTSLLAHLGHRLDENNVVLLAIKTDQLPSNIKRLSQLDRRIGVQTSIVDSIIEIAKQERVVLLIDQLDALAELMDLKTNRLDVVLQLVYRLRSVPNVHLIISCREFDFQYDSRLSSLAAEKVHLHELSWDSANRFLSSLGIATAKWPPIMCDLLRNPQHLSIFVENFAKEPILFESYQNMLEAMFAKHVENVNEFTSKTVRACEEIAAKMSQTEDLWIYRGSINRSYRGEVNRLIAAGMLKEEGRKVGFRHQTLFDYVRTRAFCSGAQSLSRHVLERQNAIFIRSTLWSALHALRSSFFELYCEEMEKLWRQANLRRHIRLMLITFLGQVNTPDDREAHWLLPALDEVQLRGKVMAAVVGNPAWFARLQSRLPTIMNAPDEVTVWQVTAILQGAIVFDRDTVFRLISTHWSEPRFDSFVLQTLRELSVWDDHFTRTLEKILFRQPVDSHFVVHLAQKAATARGGFASRLVASSLRGRLERAVQQVNSRPASPDELDAIDQFVALRNDIEPFRKLVDTTDWYGVEDIASEEAMEFIQELWPWFLELALMLVERLNSNFTRYRESTDIDLKDDHPAHYNHLPQALKRAMGLFAEQHPEQFLVFAADQQLSELLIVHRLLAAGLETLARAHPNAVLEYLTRDPRRLALGGYDDMHKETKAIVTALCCQLDVSELKPLERAVLTFEMYADRRGDDAEMRRIRRRSNREHRLRILRSFPVTKLSPEGQKLRREEEIALPRTEDFDHTIRGGMVASPVSAKQMERASDQDILNLFGELRDGVGRSHHPHNFLKGGIDQAAQAFAAFAVEQPSRAIRILDSLEAGTQEEPATYAFYSLAKSEKCPPQLVVDSIKRLARRGFCTEAFRASAAWAMQNLAVRSGGLDEDACNVLTSWISPDYSDDDEKPQKRDVSQNPQSLIWGPGCGAVPDGNYPIFNALGAAYRCRTPPNVTKWFEILDQHLESTKHPALWRTLTQDFWVLEKVLDRTKALNFLRRLFSLYPRALSSSEGVRFLANSHHWLPLEFIQDCVESLEVSAWPWKEQAVGEIAMLRMAWDPEDQYCSAIVQEAIASDSKDLRRVGIAFTCIRLWNKPRFRERTHNALVTLARAGNGYLPGAVMDLFRVTTNMMPDQKTKELLETLIANPELIQRGGPSFLTDRLQELLSTGFDPIPIAQVVNALLDAAGSTIGDVAPRRPYDAGDLIQLSLVLQRKQTAREIGLDIFEKLMDSGAYEADQVLRALDRRF